MPSDLCILHFHIPDHTNSASSTQDQAASTSATAKNGTHEFMCQLTLLEDKSTIRGTLGPLPASDVNRTEFKSCCSLQVAAVRESEPQVLTQRVKSDDLFKRGFEFYLDRTDVWRDQHYEFYIILSSYPIKLLGPPDGAQWTHSLALSESDPSARNIDPLVEMMTRFELDGRTSDAEFRFISRDGLVQERMTAHHAILSIYPALTEKLTQSQRNPHQRTTTTVLYIPLEYRVGFGRMLGFIYSGRLPSEGFAPRSDHWKMDFALTREYGLDRCIRSIPWMEWHIHELKQVITDENVLEIYFGWGHEYGHVVQLCVRHVADRSQIHFHGRDFGTYVMEILKERYQGQKGYHEFHESLVSLLMEMYADQQHQHQQQQQLQQKQLSNQMWAGEYGHGHR
ncbi:MAG: hypothetical protein J3Q66DRAFT_444933 [Benniella sp.]|nr:MAG: hypothetical protein J3Q66DRAFT_444933 [Benniella sp.]